MGSYTFQQYFISDHMMEGIRLYIDHGAPPGSFLGAVISNDLKEAVGQADEINMANLPAFVGYFYNKAPHDCWGSPKALKDWIEKKQKERESVDDPNEASPSRSG